MNNPAIPVPTDEAVSEKSAPVEIDRTANRDGVVVVRGHNLSLGAGIAETRVTLRFDGGPIHGTTGNILPKTRLGSLLGCWLSGSALSWGFDRRLGGI